PARRDELGGRSAYADEDLQLAAGGIDQRLRLVSIENTHHAWFGALAASASRELRPRSPASGAARWRPESLRAHGAEIRFPSVGWVGIPEPCRSTPASTAGSRAPPFGRTLSLLTAWSIRSATGSCGWFSGPMIVLAARPSRLGQTLRRRARPRRSDKG